MTNKTEADKLFQQALEALNSEKIPEAIEMITHAISHDPDNIALIQSRGVIYAMNDEDDLALNDYNHALEKDPHYPEALLNRGLVLYESEQYKEAIADLENTKVKGLSQLDAKSQALYFLGKSYQMLETQEKALQAFQELITLNHDSTFKDEAIKEINSIKNDTN